VSQLVLAETTWVLAAVYDLDAQRMRDFGGVRALHRFRDQLTLEASRRSKFAATRAFPPPFTVCVTADANNGGIP
jgi:hypothetical protein